MTKPAPTTPANLARIEKMIDKVQDRMGYLAMRWRDEREFEDIAEYQKVLAADLPEGFKIEKMTKSPFGFHFSLGTEAVYHLTANSRSIGWKRIR